MGRGRGTDSGNGDGDGEGGGVDGYAVEWIYVLSYCTGIYVLSSCTGACAFSIRFTHFATPTTPTRGNTTAAAISIDDRILETGYDRWRGFGGRRERDV